MLKRASLLLSFAVVPALAFAKANEASSYINVNQPFKYELYNTDILPWVSKEKTGLVSDVKGPVATALENLMTTARSKIDLAVYGVQSQEWLFRSLESLIKKRVQVRVVVDQLKGRVGEWDPHNFTYGDTARLPGVLKRDHIFPDIGTNDKPRSTIMHNKFVVIDRKSVWLGSTNLSATCMGAEYNANTSIVVHSPELAGIYANEFQQMFANHFFSIHKGARPQREILRYKDATEVEAFFSPQDNPIEEAVIPFIKSAEKTLDIAMFYLTDDRIAQELQYAVDRGVKVRLINDALAAAHPSSKHRILIKNGVHVRIENWGGKMHMKSAIADGKNVIIGSMNWSRAGSDANDENTLVIRNNRQLARKMQNYYGKLWATLNSDLNLYSLLPRAEGLSSTNSCFDGLDNDHDGFVDQADSGCR